MTADMPMTPEYREMRRAALESRLARATRRLELAAEMLLGAIEAEAVGMDCATQRTAAAQLERAATSEIAAVHAALAELDAADPST